MKKTRVIVMAMVHWVETREKCTRCWKSWNFVVKQTLRVSSWSMPWTDVLMITSMRKLMLDPVFWESWDTGHSEESLMEFILISRRLESRRSRWRRMALSSSVNTKGLFQWKIGPFNLFKIIHHLRLCCLWKWKLLTKITMKLIVIQKKIL